MSTTGFRFVVPDAGGRLDRLIADATGRGRRIVRHWLRAGLVRVDGRVANAADTPAAGSEVVLQADAPESAAGGRAALRIVIEDEHRLVVDKPAGLHCERGRSPGSVAELLEQRYGDLSRIGERPEEAGLVHRIDRDTSGILVVARDPREYQHLRRAFRRGEVTKQYLGLAAGRLHGKLDVELPLARRATHVTPAGPHDDALPAFTTLEPLDGGDDWTLVLATMRTGVTHQVRAHTAAAGYPLFGDSLYGGPALASCERRGQLLHALRVRIGDDLDATVGPPADFLAAYARLRRSGC